MENIGLIKTVGQVKKGKRYTSYFKRTAHSFIPSGPNNIGNISAIHSNFFPHLIRSFSPDITNKRIQQIRDTANKLNTNVLEQFEKWMAINNGKIEGINVSLGQITELYFALKNFNPELVDVLMEVKQILNIN